MTYDEAVTRARSQKAAGKSIEQAFAAFEGQGCMTITMLKAIRDTYGVEFEEARDALERAYDSLEPFQIRKRDT